MKFEFLKEMFSGENGGSSKRGTLGWAIVVFTFIIIVNLFTGKHPDADLTDILRDVIFAALAAVFGEPAIKGLGEKLKNALPKTQPNDDKQT